jgi:hypothetical protein
MKSFGQQAPKIEMADEDNPKVCANCCRPDGEAPVGVMTDHIHPKGQWMFSYTYMDMYMKGNKIGTKMVDDNTVFQNYYMAPDNMNMQMHMAMVMYGLTDRITLMGMFNYVINDMNMSMNNAGMMEMMQNMPGMVMTGTAADFQMKSKTSGFSDTKVYALYSLEDKSKERITVGLGLSLPTGSIKKTGLTLIDSNGRQAYPMQLGTGSYSLLPSITYVRQGFAFSWGSSLSADIKLNNNSAGYKWGNVYDATAWVSYRFLSYLSGSLRAEGISSGKISGSDNDIAILSNNDPNANTNNFGGQRVYMYAGLNFYNEKWPVKNIHFLAEYGLPVYENLNGPQMSVHGTILAGVQYMLH